jgi:tRNA nucleotidyltransferase/poly(A) polymerase
MKNYEEISDQIIKRICECGWNAYLVGGAVRDEFLGIKANDYDLVTNALPEELEKIFPDRRVKTFGASFLVTSIDDIEVSTYRSDKNNGAGRYNCQTTACCTLDEDLARRDFTFNSLAVCPYTGEVIDPFNGRKDLEKRVVKFVGDPNQRIYEDYVRMIRAARFVCLIEGKLDSETFNAIRHNRHHIKEISPERVRMELLKAMKYRRPSIFFDVLHETGILQIILPEFDNAYGHDGGRFHNETIDEHLKIAGDSLSSKDPILRLVGYLHDIGKPVAYNLIKDGAFIDHDKIGADMIKSIFNRYKFSTKDTERAKNLVLFHMRSFDSFITEKAIRKFIKKLNDYNVSFKDWFRLKIADNKANLAKANYSSEKIRLFALKVHNSKKLTKSGGFGITDLAINGNDVMQILNIPPGKEVGDTLKKLLDIVLDDPSLNNKETLVQYLK